MKTEDLIDHVVHACANAAQNVILRNQDTAFDNVRVACVEAVAILPNDSSESKQFMFEFILHQMTQIYDEDELERFINYCADVPDLIDKVLNNEATEFVLYRLQLWRKQEAPVDSMGWFNAGYQAALSKKIP